MSLPIDTSTYSFDPLFINAAMGAVINMAKHSDHPAFRWINEATPVVSRVVHSLIAAISAAGMTISYTTAEDGTMAVTLAGISVASVGAFLFTAGKNFMMQGVSSVGIDVVRRIFEMVRWMREFGPVLIDLKQQLDKQKE